MTKEVAEYIKKELEESGKCKLRGLGIFEVVPARKGVVNVHKTPVKKKWRVRFIQERGLRIEQ